MSSYAEATLEASLEIIWDCPNCGSDDADFRRNGVLAGKAICKKCKHSWKWQKPKTISETNIPNDNSKRSINKMKNQQQKDKGKEPLSSLFSNNSTYSQNNSEDEDRDRSNHNNTITSSSDGGFVDHRLDKVFSKTEERINALKLLEKNTTDISKSQQEQVEEENDEEQERASLFTSWPKKILKPKKTLQRRHTNADPDDDDDFQNEEDDIRQVADGDDDEYAECYQASSGSEFEPDFNDSDAPEEDDDDRRRRQKTKASSSPPAQGSTKKRAYDEDQDDSDNDSVFSDLDDIYEEPQLKKRKNFQKNRKAIFKPRPANRKSPWMLFNAEYRQKISEENEDLSGPEIQQRLAEIYHALPESERERYRKESQEYRKEINAQRHVRQRNEKLPGNSYIQYTKFISPQIKLQYPGISMQDRNALIAQGWKELGKEGQQKFVDQAKELLEKFKKENPEYYEAHMKRSYARRRATDEKKRLEKKRMLKRNKGN